jgi:hypothetical protein
MTKSIAAALVVLFICGWLCACGGKSAYGPEDYDITGDELVDSYLLYVEEVIVPEVIYEDEEPSIYLRVSADANPDILRGLTRDRWIGIAYPLIWEPDGMWLVDSFITGDGDPQGEPGEILEVGLPAMPPGDWICVVSTASDRSLGGAPYRYITSGSLGPVTPPGDLQEIKFTVHVEPISEE